MFVNSNEQCKQIRNKDIVDGLRVGAILLVKLLALVTAKGIYTSLTDCNTLFTVSCIFLCYLMCHKISSN